MKVILISGKAQHGKDTVAGLLEKQLVKLKERVLLTHYADLLKYICKAFFGWDGNKDVRGRWLLQYVGTDVVRNKKPGFWVEFMSTILELFGENWDFVIIPDTRFPDEISTLKEKGFDVVHLRVKRTNFESQLTDEQKQHPSETALDNIEPDYWIENSGTTEDLEHKISNWIKENLYGKHE